jgi:hypothetical protein
VKTLGDKQLMWMLDLLDDNEAAIQAVIAVVSILVAAGVCVVVTQRRQHPKDWAGRIVVQDRQARQEAFQRIRPNRCASPAKRGCSRGAVPSPA